MATYFKQNGVYYTVNTAGQPSAVTDHSILQQLNSGQLTAQPGNHYGNAGTSDPTIGAAYSAATPNTDYQPGLDYYGKIANENINEDQIRRNILGRFQKEIDAYNEIYAQSLADTKQQSLGRLGSSRAIQARSGTLGSDFGAAQTDKVNALNTEQENLVRAERAAKIAEIEGKATSIASSEIAAKRAAQQQGVEKYFEYLGKRTETKKANVAALAQDLVNKGISPDEVGSLQKIAKDYGVSVDDIKTAYNDAKAASDAAKEKAALEKQKILADIEKGKYVPIGDGAYLYNTETGAMIQNPKDFAPKSGTDPASKAKQLQSLTDKINLIDSLISSPGLQRSVGPYPIARTTPFKIDEADVQNFVAGVNQLVNKETIDTLLDLKQKGGTLGALSDQERILLQSAATKIGSWQIKDDKGNPTGKFAVSEKDFVAELQKIKSLAQKAIRLAFTNSLSEDESSLLDSEFGAQDEGEFDESSYY